MEGSKPPKSKYNKSKEIKNVYSRSLITKNISLPMVSVGKFLKQTIEKTMKEWMNSNEQVDDMLIIGLKF